MKTEILTTIEDALFELHPEAKTIYGVIKRLKEKHFEKNELEKATVIQSDLQPSSNNEVVKVIKCSRSDYNLQTRVLNIIKELGTFVKVSQIISKIKEYDPEFTGILSPVLTQMKLSGILKNVMPTGNRKHTFWGLVEWEWKTQI